MSESPTIGTRAFSKRLRRHVVGRKRAYFAVTAPGLEALCREELGAPPMQLQTQPPGGGGVVFTGRLEDCQRANLHLRTASRVLLRIGSIQATGFGVFEKRTADMAWELFLPPAAPLGVKATMHRCRLMHSEAIKERTLAAIARRMQAVAGAARGEPPEALPPQTVHIRGYRDRFGFSIDSSGDPLYIRGRKPHAGRAPVRETLAAGVLKLMGYAGEGPLVDPMCGSGTFSLEALMAARNIPAGWHREFAFEHWPSFAPKRWQYLRAAAEKEIRPTSAHRIYASDIDPEACRRLQKTVAGFGWSDSITVGQADFFSMDPSVFGETPGLVVLNPPYGKRVRPGTQTPVFFRAVAERLRSTWRGWRAVLLIPLPVLQTCSLPGFQTVQTVHGGIGLAIHYGRVP
jgi:putative N6-adenine-specific DNA methylase